MNPLALIKKQIFNNSTPHAYLFYGTDNEKKEKAIEYLKANFLKKQSGDFFEIIPQKGNISIEQARFLKNATLRTSFGKKNVFLVRQLELLTREAEVALLKTLEDLSTNNLFIATSENFNLLHPTIKSRFCSLRFFYDEVPKSVKLENSEENLEIVIRNSLLKYMNELQKTFSQNCIYKIEQLLKINQLLPISALNRRMVSEYLEMLDTFY